MAPDRGRNRAVDFEDLTASAPQDFDPEADEVAHGSSDSEFDRDHETITNGAREHYAEVGKSRLRQPKTATLGARYRGSRVGRDALMDNEDEDDPFSRDYEDEDSESEVGRSPDSDMSVGSLVDDDADDSLGSEGDANESAEANVSDDEADGVVKPPLRERGSENNRSEVLKSLAQDQKEIASRLARSNKADADKGGAVKKQRAAFDSLLGTRIKLQKALIGANIIVAALPDDFESERRNASQAVEQAEKAAFNLWSSLNDLRDDFIAARAGTKRKRTPFASSTPTGDLWSHMQIQEESNLPHRNATLQRWSVKARSATVQPQHGLLNKSERQPTIIDALQEHISNPSRLLKRAHTPRSCAPLQLANAVAEDEKIYDDADFYGLLLKELLEQKSADSATAAKIDLNFNLQREAKAKKNVDTKASKGRKLRYTVHEKLQNFMAPEDRRRWGDRQAEELFGSLFGRSMGLGEAVEEDDNMDVDGGVGDEEGLMLFRG